MVTKTTPVQTSAALVNHPRIDGVAFTGGPYYLHRFAVEKTLTVNTTAKGGTWSYCGKSARHGKIIDIIISTIVR